MTVTVTLSFDNVDQLVDFFRTTPAAPKAAFVPTPILVRPPATTGLDSRDEVNAQLAAAGIDPRPAEPYGRSPVADALASAGQLNAVADSVANAKPKRGRPRKENAAVGVVEAPPKASEPVAPAAAPSPAPTAKTYTNVEALDVFKKVKEVRGIQACFDLLARYGAGGGFRDVKPEQYPKFVADCEAVIAGKDIAAAE